MELRRTEEGDNRKSRYGIVWLILAAVAGTRLVLTIVYGVPQFDGAMNMQVPLRMLQDGTYGTLYDGGTAFDIAIQTGLPVLFPVYLLFLVFGTGITQAQVVNAVYFLLFLWLTDRIGRKLGLSQGWRLVSILPVFLMREVFDYSMGLYGEVPAAAWLLASVLLLMKYEEKGERKWLWCSGLSYGLALLTKTVMFIAVPAFVVVFLSKLFLEKKLKLREAAGWVLSCAAPYAIFMIYKFAALGTGEFQRVTQKLMGGILKQAGVSSGYSDTSGSILDKFLVHLGILSDYLCIHEVFIFVLLAANLLFLGYHIIKRRHLLYFEILALVAYSYFGWWLLITSTEKAWARRIFIGLLLMILVMAWNLSRSEWIEKLMRYKAAWPAVLTVLAVGVCWRQIPGMLAVDYNERAAVEADGEFVRTLAGEDANAVFCGNGWWQAPLLSFVSGVDFMDINGVKGTSLYYVRDKYEEEFGGDTMSVLEQTMDLERVYENEASGTVIYRVAGREPYVPFSEEEREQALEQKIEKNAESGVRGLNAYEEDNGNRWAESETGFLVRKAAGDTVLSYRLRVVNYEALTAQPLELTLYINGTETASLEAASDGEYEILAELETGGYPDGSCLEVRVSANGTLAADGDSRELAYLFEGLQLQ